MEITQFRDRTEAGQLLAANWQHTLIARMYWCWHCHVVVFWWLLKSPVLHAPLDVLVVRQLGVPGQEELAMGAIAAGGARFLNDDVVQFLGISDEVIDQAAEHEQRRWSGANASIEGIALSVMYAVARLSSWTMGLQLVQRCTRLW